MDFEYDNTDSCRAVRWCRNSVSDRWTTKWTAVSKLRRSPYS